MAARRAAEPRAPLDAALAGLVRAGIRVGAVADVMEPVAGWSTGNIGLDWATGVGGLPQGRITELFGPPSSGKTTAALGAAAASLRAGAGHVLYLDYEDALDTAYARALGLDTGDPRFVYARPRTLEEGARIFRALNSSGQLAVAVFDSVARMVSEAELESDTGKATMADRAKLLHQFCRQVVGVVGETRCAVVFLNHVLDVIDVSPMGQRLKSAGVSRRTTPGGTALKYYASLRVEFRALGSVRGEVSSPFTSEAGKAPVWMRVEATAVKNKVAVPFRSVELRVGRGLGFSDEWSVLQALVAGGVVGREAGGLHRFPEDLRPLPDKDWVRGEEAVLALLREPGAFREAARARALGVLEDFGAGGRPAPAVDGDDGYEDEE